MPWEVEYTDQFGDWWQELTERDQDAVTVMRELRAQSAGRPLRVLYAFDPRRTSILLIGGDKTGNDRFYEEYVPRADDLYDEHLRELRREGVIE